MDLVTQGLLGATAAQAGAKAGEVRLASVIGFCAPLLADADALIRSAEDPLLVLEYHRHFSHALVFIPVGALIGSMLLWPFLRKRLSFWRIYLYSFLGYATAGLLDACTSYGTHLLWPFAEDRIAWSIISILDPVFSLGLLVALGAGVFKGQSIAARAGLIFASLYLVLGGIQHSRAEVAAQEEAYKRGHTVDRLIVKPTLGNLVLWRSVYKSDGEYYIDAIRVAVSGNSTIFQGSTIEAFDIERDVPQVEEQSIIYQDIQRFDAFSDGFLAWHPDRPGVLGDVRYAMLPTSNRPLWGIELNEESPDEHVIFNTYRVMSEADRHAFLAMLFD